MNSFCKHGHEMTTENTGSYLRGGKRKYFCRTCHNANNLESKRRRKDAESPAETAEMSYEQVAKEMGISRTRVRQLETRALKKLLAASELLT